VNTENPEQENGLPDSPEPEKPEPETPEAESPEMEAQGAGLAGPETSEPDKHELSAPAGKTSERRKGGFFSFLAFVFALAALGGTAWMWWQDLQGRDASEGQVIAEIARLESSDSELALKLRQLSDQVGNLPSSDSGTEISALERRLEGDMADLDRLEQSVQEQLALSRSLQIAGESMQRRLSAAESALTGMASRELDAGGELDLAEVDYLLRLANERLKLFYDPVAADETLELADIHLAAMDDPIYLSVRQDIAAARRDLAGIDLPDYFAISNELDTIQESVARLPFKGQPAISPAPAAAAEGWWEKIKSVFSGLVTVRRSTDLEDQRISLEDMDYVRQRLWLQLEIAHLALMRRDQGAFRHSLGRVQETLVAWFEASSDVYKSVESSLESLKAMEVQLDLPDISQPWSTLRQVRQLRTSVAPVRAIDDQVEPAAPAVEPPADEAAPGEEQG